MKAAETIQKVLDVVDNEENIRNIMSHYDKAKETKGKNYHDGRVKWIQELCERAQVVMRF